MAFANIHSSPLRNMEQQEFEDAAAGLAAVSDGKALSAESPLPHVNAVPVTPPTMCSKRPSTAQFLLAGSVWSRSVSWQ